MLAALEIGGRASNLTEVFATMAELYSHQAEYYAHKTLNLLQPMLLLILGGFILLVIMGLFAPLANLQL